LRTIREKKKKGKPWQKIQKKSIEGFITPEAGGRFSYSGQGDGENREPGERGGP